MIINHLLPAGEDRESQTADPSNRTTRDAHASYVVITGGPHPKHNSDVGNTQGLPRSSQLTGSKVFLDIDYLIDSNQ